MCSDLAQCGGVLGLNAPGPGTDAALKAAAARERRVGGVRMQGTADIGQDRTGFDRGQLVLVANQHQVSLGRQVSQQFVQKLEVQHGGFIDEQHINGRCSRFW